MHIQEIFDHLNHRYAKRKTVGLGIMHYDDRTDWIFRLEEPAGKLRLLIRRSKAGSRIRGKNIGRDIRKRLTLDTHQIVRRRRGHNDHGDRRRCENTEHQSNTDDQSGQRESFSFAFYNSSSHMPRIFLRPSTELVYFTTDSDTGRTKTAFAVYTNSFNIIGHSELCSFIFCHDHLSDTVTLLNMVGSLLVPFIL